MAQECEKVIDHLGVKMLEKYEGLSHEIGKKDNIQTAWVRQSINTLEKYVDKVHEANIHQVHKMQQNYEKQDLSRV